MIYYTVIVTELNYYDRMPPQPVYYSFPESNSLAYHQGNNFPFKELYSRLMFLIIKEI